MNTEHRLKCFVRLHETFVKFTLIYSSIVMIFYFLFLTNRSSPMEKISPEVIPRHFGSSISFSLLWCMMGQVCAKSVHHSILHLFGRNSTSPSSFHCTTTVGIFQFEHLSVTVSPSMLTSWFSLQ